MSESVLPLRVRRQPEPHLNPAGDCGPCVLAGLLGWTPREVYDRLLDGQVTSIQRETMRRILWYGFPEMFDRVVDTPPLAWEVHEVHRAFGSPAHLQGRAWFNYVRMAVEAGYYGLAEVDHRKGGPLGQGINHWVLICGAREVEPPGGSGPVGQDVLVSCSSKSTPDEEWVDAHEFLRQRGGYNLLLARPAPRGEKLAAR